MVIWRVNNIASDIRMVIWRVNYIASDIRMAIWRVNNTFYMLSHYKKACLACPFEYDIKLTYSTGVFVQTFSTFHYYYKEMDDSL
jgi:hypothetical protein